MNVMLRVAGVRKLIERGNADGEYLLRFDSIYDAIEAFFELRALNRWGVEFIPDIQFHNQGGIETPNWTVNESALMICVFQRNQNGWIPTIQTSHLAHVTRVDLVRMIEEEFGYGCVFEIDEEAFGEHHVAFKVSFASVTIADRVARRWADGFAGFSHIPNKTVRHQIYPTYPCSFLLMILSGVCYFQSLLGDSSGPNSLPEPQRQTSWHKTPHKPNSRKHG